MLSGKKRSFVIGVIVAAFVLGIAAFCVYRFFFSAAFGSTFQVSMVFYDTVNQEPLSGVSVACRRSHSRKAQEAVTDAEGRVSFDLSKGKYALGWSMDGYYDGTQNITVQEDVNLPFQYLVPCAGRKEAYIVAVWDGDVDLDLCVYSDQEKRCVGRESLPGDAYVLGDVEGESYELAYLDDYMNGDYTVFIKDYDAVGAVGGVQPEFVDIRIYTAKGLLYQEQTVPGELETSGEAVLLYECARINSGAVEESGRYIADLTDYPWAARDKNAPMEWTQESVVQDKEVYSYDDAGELQKITRTEYNQGGRVTLNAAYNEFRKCIREYTWTYDENGSLIEDTSVIFGDNYSHYVRQYDAYENKIAECRYYADGSLLGKHQYEYQYDENGNILAENVYYTNSTGEQSLEYEYVYDIDGDLISLHEYSDGLLMRQKESEYDENGRLKKVWWEFYNNVLDHAAYDADGDKMETEYDAAGNKIKYTVYCYDEDGELELDWWSESKYDSAGNEICRCYFEDNGELDWWWEARYDAAGNQVSQFNFLNYEDGKWDWWWEAEYDSNGRITASYTYRGEKKSLDTLKLYEHTPEGERKIIYEYNGDGKTIADIEMWEYNIDGELTLHARTHDPGSWEYWYECTYDARGNEISGRQYGDGMVLEYAYEMEYDALDRLTVERSFSSDGSESVTTYTYTDVYDAAAGIVTAYKEIDGVIREKGITWYYP